MKQELLEKAVALRHELHRHPELSEEEVQTKERLMEFIKKNTQLQVVDRGQWFYAVYVPKAGAKKGSIAFRADMDAIRVFEDDSLPYASENTGIAHKCGHDGHSAALAAFAMDLSEIGADREVYLIFQHAEENGAGGKVCAALMEEKQITEVYGLHNFPGYEEGTLLLREGTINCASMGMELTFTGISAHASQPEKGKNPAAAISRLILELEKMAEPKQYEGLILATVVQVEIGERAFGVAAHKGKLLLTIRGQIEEEMNALRDRIEAFAKAQAQQYGLSLETACHDVFPETCNHRESIEKIRKIAASKGWKTQTLEDPIRSSEDFGWYLKKAPGALVWIGAGMECTPLHSSEFDYNDNLIERSITFFQSLL